MRATMTDNQRVLVSAVRAELGDRVDHLSDSQLSLNMGRSRKPESAVHAIEEWLDSLSDTVVEDDQENDQEDGQEDHQEDSQEDSQKEGKKEAKKKAKKTTKTPDPRLRNTYCLTCGTTADITVDEKGQWHLTCPNHVEAARTIPVTTAARMLLGFTWTQYKEFFDQDTSTSTARKVALDAKDGMTAEEIKETISA